MNVHASVVPHYDDESNELLSGYLETIALVERLHRRLLEVIRGSLERAGIAEINPIQGLLLFNIGIKVVTAGDLMSRGYYQGSNVSYNLKKLADLGYVNCARCEADRRSVRVRLTEKGLDVHFVVSSLVQSHAKELGSSDRLRRDGVETMNRDLRAVERYWTEQVRAIC